MLRTAVLAAARSMLLQAYVRNEGYACSSPGSNEGHTCSSPGSMQDTLTAAFLHNSCGQHTHPTWILSRPSRDLKRMIIRLQLSCPAAADPPAAVASCAEVQVLLLHATHCRGCCWCVGAS